MTLVAYFAILLVSLVVLFSLTVVAAALGKHVGAKAAPAKPAAVLSVAPPVSARVSLEVTEAQLNQFLVKLSLEDKQRLANYFLQTAE